MLVKKFNNGEKMKDFAIIKTKCLRKFWNGDKGKIKHTVSRIRKKVLSESKMVGEYNRV